jgi:hypothetical protein
MKKLLISNLCFFSFYAGLFAQVLSPEEMKEDLRIFRQSLEKFHPEMYRYTAQSVFIEHFQTVEKKLEKAMDQRDFYQLLQPALVSLKDGHIKWIVQGKDQHYGFFEQNLFPIRLYFEEEKVFALSHFNGEEIPQLAEIIAINGISIQSIKEQLLKGLTFGDGESLGGKYYQLNRYFSAYYSTLYGVKEVYSLDWKVNGKPEKWIGNGVSKVEIEQNFITSEEPFSFHRINGWTGILKISRFFSMEGEPDLAKFLKISFKTLADEGISNLIIDLRGNEGGSEKLGIELYKYLALDKFRYYSHLSTRPNQKVDYGTYTSKFFRVVNSFSKERKGQFQLPVGPGLKQEKPHKLAFQGNVILLLDGQSFSVTTELASRAQSDGRVSILGQETAGGAAGNSSGFFTILTLPNSKIDLGIPRIGFHMADLSNEIDPKRGIIPDEKIIPTAEEVLVGKDPVLERAFQKAVKPLVTN